MKNMKSGDTTEQAEETDASVTGISETNEEIQIEAPNEPSQAGRSLSFGSTVSSRTFLRTIMYFSTLYLL